MERGGIEGVLALRVVAGKAQGELPPAARLALPLNCAFICVVSSMLQDAKKVNYR